MIIDKLPFPDDPTPTDAPPDYEIAVAPQTTSTAGLPTPLDKHARPPFPPAVSSPGASSSSPAPSTPSVPLAIYPPPSPSPSTPTSDKGKGKAWFTFMPSRAAREVRTTVLGLVRELVRQPYDAAAGGVLDSCRAACAEQGVSFADLLQERTLEGRTPLYWAIVKRPLAPRRTEGADSDCGDLVDALLRLSAPLTPATVADVREACMAASDNALYQRCRRAPPFGQSTGADRMLLGAPQPSDIVEVEDVVDEQAAFVARFTLPRFQTRMRVGGHVACEFIARGRLFTLAFAVAPTPAQRAPHRCPPGAWFVALSVGAHSPPTPIDSRLLVEDQTPLARAEAKTPSGKQKIRPTVTLRLRTAGSSQLAPPEISGSGIERDIFARLDESLVAGSLQYDGTPYIQPDQTLRATLEAKLVKPDAECIVC